MPTTRTKRVTQRVGEQSLLTDTGAVILTESGFPLILEQQSGDVLATPRVEGLPSGGLTVRVPTRVGVTPLLTEGGDIILTEGGVPLLVEKNLNTKMVVKDADDLLNEIGLTIRVVTSGGLVQGSNSAWGRTWGGTWGKTWGGRASVTPASPSANNTVRVAEAVE